MKYLFVVSLMIFSCNNSNKFIQYHFCSPIVTGEAVKIELSNHSKIKSLDGKFIKVEGLYFASFETSGLFLSKETNHSTGLSINFNFPQITQDSINKLLSAKKVSVIGKVNLKDRGHLSSYFGSLDSVYCIQTVQN